MLRKVISVLLISMLSLSFALSGVYAQQRKIVEYGIVTGLDLLNTPGAKAWAKLFKDFETRYNVKIETHNFASETFVQEFMAARMGGEQIDVLLLNGQDLRFFATSGMLEPLKGKYNVSDINKRLVPFTKQVYTIGGTQWAVSVGGISSSGLYYNKTIFKKIGVTPPRVYKDYLVIRDKLRPLGIAPLTHMGQIIYMWPMWFFVTYGQLTKGKCVDLTTETLKGEMKFTDQSYVQAFRYIQQLAKDELFIPGVNTLNREAAIGTFMAGKAAMFFGGSWEIPGFRNNPPAGFDPGLVHTPKFEEDFPYIETGGAGNAAAIYKDSKNKDLALEFIRFLSSDENAKLLAEAERQVMTSNKNVPGSDDPLATIMRRHLPVTKVFLDWIWPPEVNKAFQINLQALVGLQTTPEDAAKYIQNVFDDLVKKGYKFIE